MARSRAVTAKGGGAARAKSAGAKARGRTTKPVVAPFRARARILALLGDQLIGSDQLAIFELVKNAYDADAEFVTVELIGLDSPEPKIEVVDDGDGMTAGIIEHVWLEPASDHRELQRQRKERTALFHRLPLGEKGVGRFAVHKLGGKIELVTRPRGSDTEHVVKLDWEQLTGARYLDETRVRIETRKPKYFVPARGRKPHGTSITIERLRKPLQKREARQLQRSIVAISSPFATEGDFRAKLSIPEHPDWIDDLPSVERLIELAPWHFSFEFDGTLSWTYTFQSPIPRRLTGRNIVRSSDRLLLPRATGERETPVADKTILEGIGTVRGNFVAYDRDPKILRLLPQSSVVKELLDSQGGVRVYRDGVRIHNYGEPGDDWLQLDMRRVNRPDHRLSRNIVVGAINLDLETSTALREKTNREGFDETEVFENLRKVIMSIIHKFEVERAEDKDRLKRLIEEATDKDEILVETPLRQLREAVAKTSDAKQILPIVDRVEREYVEMRDLLLRAGMSGLNLGIVIHEVEKGVRAIHEAVKNKTSPERLEVQSRNLMGLIESVGGLLREKSKDGVDVRELVQGMAEINVRRFRRHQIDVTYILPEQPVRVSGSSALLQNVLVNLVDNAIYWLRVRWPDQPADVPHVRRLFVGFTDDLAGGQSLVVADNGPGFEDVPEVVTKPFFTRRPDGMGLGLYYSALAMTLANGSLIFPERDDLDLPDWVDGAVVAMQFAGATP